MAWLCGDSRRAWALALLLISAGCATARDATTPADRVARITIDANGTPVVRASVDGHDALLVLDTGASYHLLDAAFARQLDLLLIEVDDAVDALGRPLPLWVSQSTKVRLGGWRVVHDGVGVAELPPRLGRDGVRGLLSPQWLDSRDGAIVLDLPALELRWLTADAAGQRYAGRTVAPLERCKGVYSVRLGVRALVNGAPTLLEIDTGASRSRVDPARPLGKRLPVDAGAAELEGVALAGSVRGRLANPMAIVIGDAQLRARPALVARPRYAKADDCEYEGALGSDVLRHCAIMFAHGRASLACTTPPAPAP